MHLDPPNAALYALIAVSLILTGAILTAGVLSNEQKGAALVVCVGILTGIAWRVRRGHHDGDDGPPGSGL